MLLQGNERACARIGRAVPEDEVTRLLLKLMRDEDRELLCLWAGGHVSNRSLACVLGCSTGTLTRRIRQLRRRIEDPLTRTIVLHERSLPPRHREIAIRRIVRGEQLDVIARHMGAQQHEVKRLLYEVIGWAKLRESHLHIRESAS